MKSQQMASHVTATIKVKETHMNELYLWKSNTNNTHSLQFSTRPSYYTTGLLIILEFGIIPPCFGLTLPSSGRLDKAYRWTYKRVTLICIFTVGTMFCMSLIHNVQFYADQSETMTVRTNLKSCYTTYDAPTNITHTKSNCNLDQYINYDCQACLSKVL